MRHPGRSALRHAALTPQWRQESSPQMLSAEVALQTATTGGAQALGLDTQTGLLIEGAQADIAIVALNGAHQIPVHDPIATLIFSSSARDVLMTMVAGREVYRD